MKVLAGFLTGCVSGVAAICLALIITTLPGFREGDFEGVKTALVYLIGGITGLLLILINLGYGIFLQINKHPANNLTNLQTVINWLSIIIIVLFLIYISLARIY